MNYVLDLKGVVLVCRVYFFCTCECVLMCVDIRHLRFIVQYAGRVDLSCTEGALLLLAPNV